MPGPVPLLEMTGIVKRFGEVIANRSVSFSLFPGEVVGLLGENGAGKTTLMNILFGLYQADEGTIRLAGEEARIASPAHAIARQIGMVHQHAHVAERHTVAENLLAGLPARGLRLDRERIEQRLGEIDSAYGLTLAPDRLVADLSVGEKQRLEILKALLRGARILILDEPTSVLTPQQTQGLFKAIRAMTADGVGVVFISHRLNEVREITSRVVVMRRGAVVAELSNDGSLTNAALARLMCGHELNPVEHRQAIPGPVRLEARGLGLGGSSAGRPIDLKLTGGEILGLAGVSGNGQAALAEALAGVTPPVSGTLVLDGVAIAEPTPRALQERGLCYIPEDRMGAGLIATLPLEASMVLPRVHGAPFSRRGILDRAAIRDFARRQIEAYRIEPPDPRLATGLLSGGNQQKAIVARELAFEPKVLIIAQPVRGLDVSAAEFVHRELMRLKEMGCAILMISDDLDEIIEFADRIAVIYEGEIVYERPAAEADRLDIGLAMTSGRVGARSTREATAREAAASS